MRTSGAPASRSAATPSRRLSVEMPRCGVFDTACVNVAPADAGFRPEPYRPGSLRMQKFIRTITWAGHEADLEQAPSNYIRIRRAGVERILAHGRDPYFPGWPDTLQLDYSNPCTQEVMIENLLKIAGQCDGVRCDMAMLILPDVFERTWGRRPEPFWPRATRR